MSGPFFDVRFVLKGVVEEPLSAVVRAFVATRSIPVPISKLIEVEMENALQAMLFRKQIASVSHSVKIAPAAFMSAKARSSSPEARFTPRQARVSTSTLKPAARASRTVNFTQ